MRINHNVSAQLANVNLKRADARMSASLERLSSGYKINKAADDSAGIAISNKMRTQIRALEQASRNSQDGQSIIQTAEGSLSEIEAIIQRMRELSVQAADDANTLDDRESIQLEIDEMLKEVDRIASTTEYNGNGLLDGSNTRVVTFNQNGFDSLYVSEYVKEGKYTITSSTVATQASATLAMPAAPSKLTINEAPVEILADDSPDEIINKITTTCDKLGIDASYAGGNFTLTTRASGSKQFIAIDDNPVSRGTDATVTLGTGFPNTLAGRTITGDGNNVVIQDSSGFKMQFSVEAAQSNVEMAVYDTGKMKLQIGANEHQDIAIDFPEVSCRVLGLKQSDGASLINVCSQEGASNAIVSFDDAIRSVSDFRSRLGAYQNRLESTTESLDVSSENLTGSMARIMDTDMAASMTDYTQESVLSQAATSILAQANNRPQLVMSLLQS